MACVCYVFVRVCLYVLCDHLLGKDWPLGPRLWCLTVSLSLSHWYPGSGVVLDCIDSLIFAPLLTFTCSQIHSANSLLFKYLRAKGDRKTWASFEFTLIIFSDQNSVIVLCFVERYIVSLLVFQSSRWGRFLFVWFDSLRPMNNLSVI